MLGLANATSPPELTMMEHACPEPGPFFKSAQEALDRESLFLAGFVREMISFSDEDPSSFDADEYTQDLETCATNVQAFVDQAEALVLSLEEIDFTQAAENMKSLTKVTEQIQKGCPFQQQVRAALNVLAGDQDMSTEDLSHQIMMQYGNIQSLICTLCGMVDANNPLTAGRTLGAIVHYSAYSPYANGIGADIVALPKLAGGFVYGLVADSELPEIEACYAGAQPLVSDLEKALDALEQVHLIKAIEHFEAFVFHLQLDLMPCTQMQDDLAALKQWASVFTSPAQLVSTATKHYLLHKTKVQNEVAAAKADLAAGSFFQAGEDVADILTTLLGGAEEAPAALQ